jgi:Cft2 family RNA processing exonuclease
VAAEYSCGFQADQRPGKQRQRTLASLPALPPHSLLRILQVCGYDGPVFMTHPTRAIAPIMLHDFYK